MPNKIQKHKKANKSKKCKRSNKRNYKNKKTRKNINKMSGGGWKQINYDDITDEDLNNTFYYQQKKGNKNYEKLGKCFNKKNITGVAFQLEQYDPLTYINMNNNNSGVYIQTIDDYS